MSHLLVAYVLLGCPVLRADETITTAGALARAMLSDRSSGCSFSFNAQVTCLIPHGGRYLYLTVSDATGHAFVTGEVNEFEIDFGRGDIISICGVLRNDEARFSRVKLVRRSVCEEPREISSADVSEGRVDWQFVRLAGVVRDICDSETDRRWTFLVLATSDETIYVGVPAGDYRTLLGASVKVDGFANPRDRSPRVYFGRTFHCRGASDIHVQDPQSQDLFSVPHVRMLRHLDPTRIARLGRHYLQGRVLCRWKGNHALVRTPDNEVVHLVFDGLPPSVGTDLVASGFPETDFFHLTLTHTVWRRTENPLQGIPDEPARGIDEFYTRLYTEQPLNTSFHGRLVTLKGFVRSLPTHDETAPRILVDCGGHLTTLDVGCLRDSGAFPPVGSEIAVTGTCVLETEDYRPNNLFPQIGGLFVVLNRVQDLMVLRRPPWWTPGRLLAVIALLLATLLLLFIWNRILNRLVERRGRQLLKEQLGHAAADLRTNERMRLAVELHDSLAQNLTGVSMEIEAAGRCGPGRSDDLMQHLKIADKALKSCRNELRNTLWDLRNQSLEARDFNEAIRKTLLPHVKHVALEVRVDVPRQRLLDNVAHDLLCIVRELVLNAIHHGAATTIGIRGGLEDSVVRLSVRDNGRGFDPDDSPGVAQGHFGLEGIRERLREPGGELSFCRRADGMTAIITYPL